MNSTRQKIVPPSATSWPIVGTVPQLYWQQLDFLAAAQAKHGDIFSIKLGKTDLIVLAHPRQAQHVLIDNAKNYRNKGDRGFRIAPVPLMRGGLATAVQPQAEWKQQRRGVQPYFHHRRLEPLTELMSDAVAESLETWQAGQVIDLELELTRMTVNVIGRSIFGTKINTAEADQIAAEVRIVMDYLWLGTIEYELPNWMPIPGRKRYQRAMEVIRTFIETLIERSLRPDAHPGNLMAILAELVAEGHMSQDQLSNEAVTLLITGYESTAASLSWTLYMLAQNQAVDARLRAEIDAVLGERRANSADISALTYTRMTFKEGLRYYSPSYWIQRQAAQDDEIDGFHIPAGTMVASLIHLVHHHPDVWQMPQTFDPERFSSERSKNRHNLAWLPFGAGQRMCMATEFALIKGQLILSQIYQAYRLTSVSDKKPSMAMASNLRPKETIWVAIEQRPDKQ
ncbi:MAG: cytochrome P450 [Candidatus Promineifilaceae bacterium]